MTNEDKIRNRASYKMFNSWMTFIEKKPDALAVLHKLYEEFDSHFAFKTAKNSAYAKESLELVIKDNK